MRVTLSTPTQHSTMSAYLDDGKHAAFGGSGDFDDKKDVGWSSEIVPVAEVDGELGRGNRKQTLRTFKPR